MLDENFKEFNSVLSNVILATILVILMTIMNTYMITSYSNNKLLNNQELFSAPIIVDTFQESNKVLISEDDINVIKDLPDGKTVVNELEIVKYRITVINNRKQNLKNIIVKDSIPQNTVYTENVQIGGERNYVVDTSKKELTWVIEHLNIGETYTIEYEVLINPLGDKQQLEVGTKATLSAEDVEKTFESNCVNVKIVKTDYKLDYRSSKSEDEVLKLNSHISYYGIATNISKEVKSNSKVTVQLPKEVEYISINVEKINTITGENVENNSNIEYNKIDNNVIITTSSMQPNEAISFTIYTKVSEVSDNKIKSFFWIDNQFSKEITNTIAKTNLVASMRAELLKDNDVSSIVYTIEVENLGNTTESNVLITDIIPETLKVQECTINNVKIDSNQIVTVNTIIKPNDKAVLKVKAIKSTNACRDVVVNWAFIKSETGDQFRTNSIICRVKPDLELDNVSMNNTLLQQSHRFNN